MLINVVRIIQKIASTTTFSLCLSTLTFRFPPQLQRPLALYQGPNNFTKSAIQHHQKKFHITKESEDEQRPVLVSAHPPPKIHKKLPFMET